MTSNESQVAPIKSIQNKKTMAKSITIEYDKNVLPFIIIKCLNQMPLENNTDHLLWQGHSSVFKGVC